MISFIRRMFESKIGAILAIAFVAVIGLAFALGDVSSSISGSGVSGGNVAKVGSQDIGVAELNDAMNNAFKQVQQENPGLTMAAFIEQGGLEDVYASLVNRVTVAEYARKHGITVSKAMVDAEIRDISAFQGLDGQFNQETFLNVLRQNNLTEEQFRTDVRRGLYLEQILSAAGVGSKAGNSMTVPYASLILEERKGELGIIPSEAFVPKREPSEKELAAFYQANRATFVVPERRSIRYVEFGADSMANKVQVSDSEVAQYYNANKADYAASEERTISQIIVPTEAAAKAVQQRASKGESLSAIASDIGVAVSTADKVSRAGYAAQTSDAVAAAAFGTPIGNVAPPAKGDLGWYVVKPESERSIAAKPLSAVSADIRQKLLTQRRQEALDEMTGDIDQRCWRRDDPDIAGGNQFLDEPAQAKPVKVRIVLGDCVGHGVLPMDSRRRLLAARTAQGPLHGHYGQDPNGRPLRDRSLASSACSMRLRSWFRSWSPARSSSTSAVRRDDRI